MVPTEYKRILLTSALCTFRLKSSKVAIAKVTKSLKKGLRNYRLYDYASQYWGSHARDANIFQLQN